MVPAPGPPQQQLDTPQASRREQAVVSEKLKGLTPQCDVPAADTATVETLIQAITAGNLTECQRIISEEGGGILQQYDDKGHTPAHWAALQGHVEIIKYFITCNGPVDLPSKRELAQHPIHWAAVNGHIAVIDLLLKAGVSPDTPDGKRSTPLITAAQYGHASVCCYLIGKGAELQVSDSEGDNPLHWAAFKGHCELTRLLIYSGCNPRQKDAFGQTPLHLAVLSGDLLTVKLLCEEDGVELDIEDRNGNTPLKLARGRQYTEIVTYLENAIARSKSIISRFDWSSLVFGPPGKSKGAIFFFCGIVIFWGYPTYFLKIVPVSYTSLWGAHITFLFSNVIMWYFFLTASWIDPGFLPQCNEEYDRAIRQAVYLNTWKWGQNPLSRLCHTCHLVKPLRSKHCRVTNRCVSYFDHYCPYIYNDVGYRNRTYFVGFLATMCLNCTLGVYLCWNWFLVMGCSIFIGLGFLVLAFNAVMSGIMTCMCMYMAAVNITTNERINQNKYSYLKDGRGMYRNPFDRGVYLNLLEFFHLRKPLQEKHIRTLEQLPVI